LTKIIGSAALTAADPTGENLTTKGDLHGFSDENTRIPISTNNFSLLADSAQALGLKWAASPTSILTTQSDLLYASSANTLARLAKGTAAQVLTMNAGATAPEWAAAVGDPNLEFIDEVKLGGTAAYIEKTSGFEDYSVVFIFFNLAESGSGTFVPMCQFYSGGSLITAASYGVSECINGASASKTNGQEKIFLDGNTTANSTLVGYLSIYTGGGSQQPSQYTGCQGQFQLGLQGVTDAPDCQVQLAARYTAEIEGIRFTEEGTSALFAASSAIKMYGVKAV